MCIQEASHTHTHTPGQSEWHEVARFGRRKEEKRLCNSPVHARTQRERKIASSPVLGFIPRSIAYAARAPLYIHSCQSSRSSATVISWLKASISEHPPVRGAETSCGFSLLKGDPTQSATHHNSCSGRASSYGSAWQYRTWERFGRGFGEKRVLLRGDNGPHVCDRSYGDDLQGGRVVASGE